MTTLNPNKRPRTADSLMRVEHLLQENFSGLDTELTINMITRAGKVTYSGLLRLCITGAWVAFSAGGDNPDDLIMALIRLVHEKHNENHTG